MRDGFILNRSFPAGVRPIDVLAAMNPIMIIDEPQPVEGKQKGKRLKDFKPLFTLRWATHKESMIWS